MWPGDRKISWKAARIIQVRAPVGVTSGNGHGMMRSGWAERYLGELTGPAGEGLEALSEGSALVAPLTKMEQVLALSSEQDMLNWWNSGEYSGLVAEAGVNYASVVYLPTIFIHSFISANIGFLSCVSKVLRQSGTQNSQNLLSGLTWQWGNSSNQ